MAGLQMKYFVLNPEKDNAYGRASRLAMATYAAAIRDENPQLATELLQWVCRKEPLGGRAGHYMEAELLQPGQYINVWKDYRLYEYLGAGMFGCTAPTPVLAPKPSRWRLAWDYLELCLPWIFKWARYARFAWKTRLN